MPEEINVGYVAKLCRLELTDEELQRYQTQHNDILAYMQQIQDLDVDGIEPTPHASPDFDVLRPDEARETLSHEDVLRNAPQQAHDQFSVTKVVE